MYRGHYRVYLGEEEVSKIEKMLKEKWYAKDIVIKKLPTCWKVSFLTDDHKKVFGLLGIIRRYGGRVLYHWIEKVNR